MKYGKVVRVIVLCILFFPCICVNIHSVLQTYLPAVARALQPTLGTVRPSAKLGSVGVKTGLPACIALMKL